MRATGWGLRTLGHIAPNRAAATSAAIFCRPAKNTRPAREREWLASADPFRARQGRSEIQAWRWGDSQQVVFLMHGWAGRGAQLGAMVQPLLDRGLSVVTWDAPGHGDSPGRSSSLVEIADSAFAVARKLRLEPHGIIAHSMGASAATLAIAEGLSIQRAALISPPASLLHFTKEYAEALGFSAPMRDRLIASMNRTFSVNMADFDIESMNVKGGDRVLVIHDTNDREVPIEHGQRVAKAIRAGRFHRTEKLGHRRILHDGEIVQEAAGWVSRLGSG